GGLPRPGLAHQHQEALALGEPVGEVGQRVAVGRREVQEARVGGQVERLLGEAVVGLVHYRTSGTEAITGRPSTSSTSRTLLSEWSRLSTKKASPMATASARSGASAMRT